MTQTVVISLLALTIDFLVCLIFGSHLFIKNRKGGQGKYAKLFTYFFFLFALFMLITLFYIPGIVTSNPGVLKTAFMFAFAVLMVIAVLIINIIFTNSKIEEYLVPIWAMSSVLVWLYLLFTINPANPHPTKWGFWGFSPWSLALAIFTACAPFFAASGIFFSRAIKERETRVKYLFFSAGFLLIVVGGPLHQFGKIGSLFLLADFVTTLGFGALFTALLIKQKQKV